MRQAETLRVALQLLMDRSRAIVGADTQDENSHEAFEMYWAAMKQARIALATSREGAA